jgi:hypothetical protein
MLRTAIIAALLLASAGAANAQTGRTIMAEAAATVQAPVSNPDQLPQVFHVYNTPDGESHLEVLKVAATAGDLPLANLRAISYRPNKVDWHNVPTPQFAINLTGELQVETSDGTKHKIGPGDLVYLEDAKGKGHITRLLGPVTALFIRATPGFDIRKWAAGEQK